MRVQRRHAVDLEHRADLQVVLQVLADAGQRRARRAMPCCCSSAAGPMPESCRICGVPIAPVARITSPPSRSRACTGAPPPCGQHLDADGARGAVPRAVGSRCASSSARDLRAGPDLQVVALLHRAQEGLGRVPAHAGALVDLEVAHAFVVAAVEVVAGRDAGLLRGLREGVEDLPAQALLLDAPLAARRARRSASKPGAAWKASAPLWKSSCFRKCGRHSAQLQPGLPSAPQWS